MAEAGIGTRYIARAVQTLETWPGRARDVVLGCTAAELASLEAKIPEPYRLPEAYREFLLYGGRELAGVFDEDDFSYKKAKLLCENLPEITEMLTAWDPTAVLAPDIFVFREHLGSNFSYFKLTEGENPPVYFWVEGKGGLETSVKDQDTFSGYLLRAIETYIGYREGR